MKNNNFNKKEETVVYEEVGEEVFGKDTYQSSFVINVNKLRDKFNQFKKNKFFIPVAALVIFGVFFLIVMSSILIGGSSSKTNITSIGINIPNIIYVNDEQPFAVNVYGTGALNKTELKFSVSNESVAEILSKSLTGDNVNNKVVAKASGVFYIDIVATNGNSKEKLTSEKISICKRLTNDLFESNTITIKKDKSKYLDLDLGKPTICNENIKYEIENEDIAVFKSDKVLLGVKKGTTKLTITAANKSVTLTINII